MKVVVDHAVDLLLHGFALLEDILITMREVFLLVRAESFDGIDDLLCRGEFGLEGFGGHDF